MSDMYSIACILVKGMKGQKTDILDDEIENGFKTLKYLNLTNYQS
jgi:hypothetical protein